jgi:hypothetical protein
MFDTGNHTIKQTFSRTLNGRLIAWESKSGKRSLYNQLKQIIFALSEVTKEVRYVTKVLESAVRELDCICISFTSWITICVKLLFESSSNLEFFSFW